jgi:CBS domain-containing protein
MKVKHVMTKDPTCCLASDKAPRAASIMRDQDVGSVPVIDNEQAQRIVGIVTDRDLCMRIVAEGRDPSSVAVEACMTMPVVMCSANDSVQKATELMRENQVRRIAVVDDAGRLVGIVAMADVATRAELKATETHETLEKVSEPSAAPSKPRGKSRPAA